MGRLGGDDVEFGWVVLELFIQMNGWLLLSLLCCHKWCSLLFFSKDIIYHNFNASKVSLCSNNQIGFSLSKWVWNDLM